MNDGLLTVRQALRDAQQRGLARLDGQLLMAHLLERSRTWLLAHDDHPLTPGQQSEWQRLVARRLDQMPLAYLTGQHEFFGLALAVTPAVLDPRPDTETLVEWALERLTDAPQAPRVLDLGTGSGAIALAIAHARPDARVTAVDLSADALAVAALNGQRLGLPVRWLHGRWFDPVAGECFDLVVSNPPYLADDDPHLPALHHEPRSALCAGPQGLDDLRHLAAHAANHLVPGGWLLLEHGYDQRAAVAALLQQHGWEQVTHRHDLAGHTRCTGGATPCDRRPARGLTLLREQG